MVATGLTGRYDLLDPIDGVDVDDLVVIRPTDAEDGHGQRYQMRVSVYMGRA